MSTSKKIVFFILSFIIFLVFFEIIFKVIEIRPSNSNYGWLNSHKTYNYLIEEITVNKYGTRDTKKIDKNKKNIILLGDSQVETAQKKENMPARILENYLNDNYNVYSLGSWGWGTDQQLLILKKTINEINPQHVIVFFTPNDLTDNFHYIGINGEKPTYKLNKNNKLSEPSGKNLKKFLNNFWTYRILFRIILLNKSRNYKNFISEENFQLRNNCSENQELSIKKLIDSRIDYNFYVNKYKKLSKKNPKFTSDEEIINKQYYTFFNTRNNYELKTDKGLDYFRDIRTELESKKIEITNKLLKEIQKISGDNSSKMFLINVINYNYLFKEDKDYKICLNNKEVIYSNSNYFKIFNDTLKGINNIINFEIEKGIIDYDLDDGHLNFELSSKLFKKVSTYIKQN